MKKESDAALVGILPGLLVYLTEEYIKGGVENGRIYIPKVNELKEMHIFGNKIRLRHLRNTGVARGMLGNNPQLVSVSSAMLTGVVFGALLKTLKNKNNIDKVIKLLGLSLLLGGSVSNTKDRLERGYVVDYFSTEFGPEHLKDLVFNISDLAIIVGALITGVSFGGLMDEK